MKQERDGDCLTVQLDITGDPIKAQSTAVFAAGEGQETPAPSPTGGEAAGSGGGGSGGSGGGGCSGGQKRNLSQVEPTEELMVPDLSVSMSLNILRALPSS